MAILSTFCCGTARAATRAATTTRACALCRTRRPQSSSFALPSTSRNHFSVSAKQQQEQQGQEQSKSEAQAEQGLELVKLKLQAGVLARSASALKRSVMVQVKKGEQHQTPFERSLTNDLSIEFQFVFLIMILLICSFVHDQASRWSWARASSR